MQNQSSSKKKLRKKSKLILIFIPIALIIAIGIFFFRTKNNQENKLAHNKFIILEKGITQKNQPENQNPTIEDITASLSPECINLNKRYSKLGEIKQLPSSSLRYQNIHKRMDGNIYRLRFFYKDGAENERKQFLVYKENQILEGEEAEIVEKTPYKKGRLYLMVEKNNEEILYNEEAYTLGSKQEVFVVYINQRLNLIQAQSIECKF